MRETPRKICPVLALLSELGKQWVLLILFEIGRGHKYFSSIKNSLPGMSSRTLSLRLKDLQDYGMIQRTIVSEQPVRIEYSLTEKGVSFQNQLDGLAAWGREWGEK